MQQSVTLIATLTKMNHQKTRIEQENSSLKCSQKGFLTVFYTQKGLLFQSRNSKGECGTKKGKQQVYCCQSCYLRKFI